MGLTGSAAPTRATFGEVGETPGMMNGSETSLERARKVGVNMLVFVLLMMVKNGRGLGYLYCAGPVLPEDKR